MRPLCLIGSIVGAIVIMISFLAILAVVLHFVGLFYCFMFMAAAVFCIVVADISCWLYRKCTKYWAKRKANEQTKGVSE